MFRCLAAIRLLSMLLCVGITLNGCTSSSGGGGVGGSDSADEDDSLNDEQPADGGQQLESLNAGGGELAAQLGSASFAGQASGPTASGSLALSFDSDGVLLILGGGVLGSFFGWPEGTEVVFDYQNEIVTGTFRSEGSSDQPLEDVLAESGQFLTLERVVVTFAGNSLLVNTFYSVGTGGSIGTAQNVQFQATLQSVAGDRRLQGALELPGLTDDQAPIFTLSAR